MAQPNNQADGNRKTLNPQPPFNAEIESVCDVFRSQEIRRTAAPLDKNNGSWTFPVSSSRKASRQKQRFLTVLFISPRVKCQWPHAGQRLPDVVRHKTLPAHGRQRRCV